MLSNKEQVLEQQRILEATLGYVYTMPSLRRYIEGIEMHIHSLNLILATCTSLALLCA